MRTMTIGQRIDAELKKAMLAKDETARDALRLAKSELMNREVELGRPLTDEEAVVVMQKGVKSRRDAIEQYKEGGRQDLVDNEERQLAVLAPFLPKTLDETETRAAIVALVKELALAGKKDMGRLMKELKARHEGLDGRLASKLAGELLGS